MASNNQLGIDCEQCREQLSAFFDAELSPETTDAVAEHLVLCAECSQHLSDIQRLCGIVAALSTPRLPSGLWPRIASQLTQSARDITK